MQSRREPQALAGPRQQTDLDRRTSTAARQQSVRPSKRTCHRAMHPAPYEALPNTAASEGRPRVWPSPINTRRAAHPPPLSFSAPPPAACLHRDSSRRRQELQQPRQLLPGKARMPRCKDKRRGRSQANAAPARARPDLVGYTMEGSTIVTPYVPAGVIYRKKAQKHGKLSARRTHMKALMSMKAGTTGYGCLMGCHAIITYPLSEEEKSLMESMVYGADDVNGAGEAGVGAD